MLKPALRIPISTAEHKRILKFSKKTQIPISEAGRQLFRRWLNGEVEIKTTVEYRPNQSIPETTVEAA